MKLPLRLLLLSATAPLSQAALIFPDSAGDVRLTPGDSGENNVLILPGQPSGPHEIRLASGTLLRSTGPGPASIDIRTTRDESSSYTVNTSRMTLIDAGDHDAITNRLAATRPQDLVVNLGGTIRGGNGIVSDSRSLAVTNLGSVDARQGSGIISSGTLTLTNGTLVAPFRNNIEGRESGITASGPSSTIDNFGVISGDIGIVLGNGATIGNLTSMPRNMYGVTRADGAFIRGFEVGIMALDRLTFVNQRLSTLRGTETVGIHARDNARITNEAGARIFGDSGINAGDSLTLRNLGIISTEGGIAVAGGAGTRIVNHGMIRTFSENATAIRVSGNSTISNSGLIAGDSNNAITVDSSDFGDTFRLSNSRVISAADTAISSGFSDDSIDLHLRSRIVGDVELGTGNNSINFFDGLASPGGFGNSISGNVLGVGTITKVAGSRGTAFIGLPGDGNFGVSASTINIDGGGLYLNADLIGLTNLSKINANGTALGGTGRWEAVVDIGSGGISAGAIPIDLDENPANSIGLLSLVGPVNHSPGTFIRFDVKSGPPAGAGRDSDLISHRGTAGPYSVSGAGIRIASTDNNRVIRDGTYTVVDSILPISGIPGRVTLQSNPNVNATDTGFVGSEIDLSATSSSEITTSVLANNFSIARVSEDGTDILLDVKHDFSSLATTRNAAALGNALDASIASDDADTGDFIAALDYSDLPTVRSVLGSLAPDSTLATASAIVSGNQQLNRLAQDHLALARAESGYARSYVGSYPGPAPQPLDRTRGNVWGTASYQWKNIGASGGNFDGENASFTAGVDYRIAPNLLFGLLLDGSTADYDSTGGGSDVDSYRAALYATYGKATGVYADFLVGYGDHDLDLRSTSPLGPVTNGTGAESLQGMLNIGYSMRSGAFRHGPFAGIEYQDLEVDGYVQSSAFPILVNDYGVDSLRLSGGYRVEADYGKFTPYASVAYAHELEDDDISARASIASGSIFRVSGEGLGSAVLVSAGTDYSFTRSLSMYIGYHGEISADGGGTDSHGASVGLNCSF